MGTHSYNECFHGFFHHDEAITLEARSDGRYRVANGYHRIFVARTAGRNAVPAKVSPPPTNAAS